MGEGTIPLGERGQAVGSTSTGVAQALGIGRPKDQAGPDSYESVLAHSLIEDVVKEQDRKDKQTDWKVWVPELEKTFKDKMFSLVAERFKIDSIAASAHERGARSIEEVLKMIADFEGEARERYPKYAWLDAIYKYLGDTR